MTFIYTRCPLPEFCPTLERRFAAVMRRVATDPALAGARLVSVSIDPDYDRPPVLAAHAASLQADTRVWRLVTGDREAIERFGERFGLTLVRGNGTPGELVHSMKTVVVDPNLRLLRVFDGSEWTVEALIAALGEARIR
jgi:protein SCO1/2